MGKKQLLHTTITICVSVLLVLNGCAMADKLFPLPEVGVKVNKDKIYHNEKAFAELRYFVDKQYNIQKGVAIYYYYNNKEVWIFPKEGWSVRLGGKEYFAIQDIDLIWNKYLVDHQAWATGKRNMPELNEVAVLRLGGKNPPKIQPSVFDIKISEDGKYVYYKTPGLLFDSLHKYSIEYGTSKVVEKNFHQRLW